METSLLNTLSDNLIVNAMGWTLMHFFWQGLVIAIVIATVLGVARRASSKTLYAISSAGLVAMVATVLATFVMCLFSSDRGASRTAARTVPAASLTELVQSGVPSSVVTGEQHEVDGAASNRESVTNVDATESEVVAIMSGENSSVGRLGDFLRSRLGFGLLAAYIPIVVGLWIVGVGFLWLRLLTGVGRVRRWRSHATFVKSQPLVDRFSRLLVRMEILPKVAFLESTELTIPAVIGWLRPAVIVPASMITGMTVSEIEAVMAHELAHIRRHDYLVNLIQTMCETVLFFHPAVWWLSRRIRSERENCCDDIAIEVCGNRNSFVTALARMEEWRCRDRKLVVAATGGSLVSRIRRLTCDRPGRTGAVGAWLPGGILAVFSIALISIGVGGDNVAANHAGPELERQVSPDPNELVRSDSVLEKDGREESYQDRKLEVKKKDSKTGIEKSVFAGIQMSHRRDTNSKNSSLDMMYSNVMMYSFVTARVARELGATQIGEIDFGTSAPKKKGELKTVAVQQLYGAQPNQEHESDSSEKLTVNELTVPVGNAKVVPYSNDAIWIPAHLGIYGMNQKKQHRFKIVRIERVDLGVGRPFGPVNALVLDDENSDFGVLGRNWSRLVRGENDESLWHSATGSFFLKQSPKLQIDQPVPAATSVTQEPNPSDEDQPAIQRPDGVTLVKSHSYPTRKRVSTKWIEVKRNRLPVDNGIEFQGVTVYLTLFYDVIAVDSKTGKVLWDRPWRKQNPFWQTLSILQFDVAGETKTVVELHAPAKIRSDMKLQYHDLKSGESVELPKQSAADETRLPWVAKGRITDRQGNPLEGVGVNAHCGMGTLFQTGTAITDADGRYELRFGQGIWSTDPAMIQVATITAGVEGHFEKNMCRHGGLAAALKMPPEKTFWRNKTVDDLFLPNQPKTIDFVFLPCASVRGVVYADDGAPRSNVQVSLKGDEMPPSQSVVAHTRTNQAGEFKLDGLPTGFKFQFMVEPKTAEPPWNAWVSSPLVFRANESDVTVLEYAIDGEPIDLHCSQVNLNLRGAGASWKSAMKNAAQRPLRLQFDGKRKGRVVDAGQVALELGGP